MATQATKEHRIAYDLSGYTPHAGQRPFHASEARLRVLACGRRWGKDRCCEYEMYRLIPDLIERNRSKGLVPTVLIWYVSPTFPLSDITWAEIKAFCPPGFAQEIRESDRMLRCWGGVEIQMKTALEPERLVGAGLDLLIVGEAALIAEEAWTTALRPTLSSPGRLGRAVFNSTPKGLNWFHKLYLRGQDSQDTEVESWNYPTSNNPYVEPGEIALARAELPETVFLQEYEAQFLSDVGLVFRHVEGCVQGELEKPREGHRYLAGIDLAKHHDFTVVTIADASTRRVVHFDRFSQLDYALQKERIREALGRYNGARAWLDSTGVGDPVLEDLQRMGLRVEGYHMTGPSKRQLIDGLCVALEQELLRFPPIPQLINELKAYQYEQTTAGNLRTAAPYGYYDDCVVSLALLNYGLKEAGGGVAGSKPVMIRRLW